MLLYVTHNPDKLEKRKKKKKNERKSTGILIGCINGSTNAKGKHWHASSGISEWIKTQ